MDKITKVFIVDDSPFSITVIRQLFDRDGFEVVGDAKSKKEAIEKIPNAKPDIITMDMVLEDTDGIDCSRAILTINPEVKIIAISSMLDDDIVKKAKDIGIFDYIQKPIDGKELFNAIEKAINFDSIFEKLDENYLEAFKEALLTNSKRSLKSNVSIEEISHEEMKDRNSNGVSVVLGIVGAFKGRIIIDSDMKLSTKIAEALLGMETDNEKFIIDSLSEFANVVAGNGISMLNKTIEGINLRISPPTTLYGKDLHISLSEMKSKSIVAKTECGDIYLNIGFERGN